ncbi:MOXD1 homolog 1-like [Macrosteles quadrilineatus]|uniref:MOXD1 homolog 1-like n=1 Tax=Macrosteles quadrilineatus TaxID=74068 RepID=UPI0023E1E48A|nr:MOXD1 homolog 1-like [Macrosteles quadrilineatus]
MWTTEWLGVIVCVAVVRSATWRSSVDLSPEGDVRLSWTPRTERVEFQVEARTTGYVGIGFSRDGSMRGADLVIGWVEDNSQKVFLLDYHGTSRNGAPVLDTSQNYELLGGHQNTTHTVIRFQRAWDTCDHQHDKILGNDTERIIWAWHSKDPQESGVLEWHDKLHRGSRSVHLISGTNHTNKGANIPHVKQWDVLLNNFSVPENMDTMYWCKIFKIPSMNGKRHIIGYEPIISAGSQGLVHHMLLYSCAGGAQLEAYSDPRHPGAPCHGSDMPTAWETCVAPAVAWAVSSNGEFLPDHVGIPIGENRRSTFFMLEIHYDNPTLKKVVDSSGLRVFYTDKLRANDGAILVTGIIISPLQVIPPYQTNYKTAGYCDFHCTHSTLPSEINVVSALLHSHRAGREIKLRHVRNGVELPPIAQDKTYDFNYQQSRVLLEEKQILPGDEIITECVYNTESRNRPTVGGFSTKQEMCLSFLTYYPRSPLASCLSMTPVDFFFQTFGVNKFYHYNMSTIEQMFLRLTDSQIIKKTVSTTPPTFPKLSMDDEVDEAANQEAISTLRKMADFSIIEGGGESSLFDNLIIEEPEEFHNRSFVGHLHKMPWSEQLLTDTIETTMYHGKHMTFCRLYNDSLQTQPQVFKFPNFTKLEASSLNSCPQSKESLKGTPNGTGPMLVSKYDITFVFILFNLVLK